MAAMSTDFAQPTLFESHELPHGLVYRPDFVTRDEEAQLVGEIEALPFHEAKFREYTARRRVVSFGMAYDDEEGALVTRETLPPFLVALRDKVARWQAVAPEDFVHVLASEYRPGTPIGWHRDRHVYGFVVGVSLAGSGRMRFRPLGSTNRRDIVIVDLAPRSAYVMRGPIRWQWQHSLLPVQALRYSVTMRTLAQPGTSIE
jgi:alkylated DNA repair dioxygenase AlkB